MQEVDQSLKVKLHVRVLSPLHELVPVHIGECVGVGIVIKVSSNQAFVVAMRLIIDVSAGFVRKLVQQLIQDGQARSFTQEGKARPQKKGLNLPANIGQFVVRTDRVPGVKLAAELADRHYKRISVGPVAA